MPRFFVEEIQGDMHILTGQDAVHIRRALRMKPKETLTLCDGRGTDYFAEIQGFEGDNVVAKVLYHTPTACEPDCAVTLYQGIPKGDKMDVIIQKAVELGVHEVVPVTTSRSIVRMKGEDAQRKCRRWQRIACEAAGQCGRGIQPKVRYPVSVEEAAGELEISTAQGGLGLVFYEGGGAPLSGLVGRQTKNIAIFVGPEGGIEAAEVDRLCRAGAVTATLGKRILRCETAPLAALAVLMQLTGNLE